MLVSPSVFESALLGEAHPMLDLGDGLLDRIEVWRVLGFIGYLTGRKKRKASQALAAA